MRPTKTGVVASVLYLAVSLVWLLVGGQSWLFGAWILAVALVGSFIPGEANQVSLARA